MSHCRSPRTLQLSPLRTIRAPHHDKRHDQFGNSIFDGNEGDRIHGITCIADDEKLAKAAAKQDFCKDAAVGTGDVGCKRCLPFRDVEPALPPDRCGSWTVIKEVPITFNQPLERFVGKRCSVSVDDRASWLTCSSGSVGAA